MTVLLACGSRTWLFRERLFANLDELHAAMTFSVVIEGCAHGADELAGFHEPDPDHMERFGHPFDGGWAWSRGIPGIHFPVPPAEWRKYGKKAGNLRNSRMLADGEPEYVVAFDMGSRGTADMLRKVREFGLGDRTYVVSEGTL